MYKLLTLILISFGLSQNAFAQTSTTKKKKGKYSVWLVDYNYKKTRAFLYALEQDKITLAKYKTNSTTDFVYQDFPINMVRELQVRKDKKVLKGALFGGLIGMTLGIIIGNASGDDSPDSFFAFTKREKATINGALFGTLGSLMGTLFSIQKIKIRINRDPSQYNYQKVRLRPYLLE